MEKNRFSRGHEGRVWLNVKKKNQEYIQANYERRL